MTSLTPRGSDSPNTSDASTSVGRIVRAKTCVPVGAVPESVRYSPSGGPTLHTKSHSISGSVSNSTYGGWRYVVTPSTTGGHIHATPNHPAVDVNRTSPSVTSSCVHGPSPSWTTTTASALAATTISLAASQPAAHTTNPTRRRIPEPYPRPRGRGSGSPSPALAAAAGGPRVRQAASACAARAA